MDGAAPSRQLAGVWMRSPEGQVASDPPRTRRALHWMRWGSDGAGDTGTGTSTGTVTGTGRYGCGVGVSIGSEMEMGMGMGMKMEMEKEMMASPRIPIPPHYRAAGSPPRRYARCEQLTPIIPQCRLRMAKAGARGRDKRALSSTMMPHWTLIGCSASLPAVALPSGARVGSLPGWE